MKSLWHLMFAIMAINFLPLLPLYFPSLFFFFVKSHFSTWLQAKRGAFFSSSFPPRQRRGLGVVLSLLLLLLLPSAKCFVTLYPHQVATLSSCSTKWLLKDISGKCRTKDHPEHMTTLKKKNSSCDRFWILSFSVLVPPPSFAPSGSRGKLLPPPPPPPHPQKLLHLNQWREGKGREGRKQHLWRTKLTFLHTSTQISRICLLLVFLFVHSCSPSFCV